MLKEKQNKLLPYKADHVMEPYSIIRRSKDNPLFHPYFINYGFNKQELMNRMTFLSRSILFEWRLEFHYYVMLNEFCVEIPHKRTRMSKEYVSQKKTNYDKTLQMYKLTSYFKPTYNIRLNKWHW